MSATVLAPVARQLFLNPSNGAPASGFKLFTYAAGTATKLATYVDATGNTPNTNPIILDTLGECDLWFTPNVPYKLVFANATDTDPPTNPIWSRDNIINGEEITLSGAISFPTTAELLAAFPSSETLADGAIAVTAGRTSEQDRGGATFYYNASDTTTVDNGGTIRVDTAGRRWYALPNGPVMATIFGMDPTGVADSSAAWQSAINYCNTQAFAASASALAIATQQLWIPPGVYKIVTGATVSSLNFEIIGAGRELVRFVISPAQNLLNVTSTILQFTLEGISTSGGAGVVYHTETATNVEGQYSVRDCAFYDYTQCAIGSCSIDMPYWKIQRNLFSGTSSLTSFGIALAGNNDQSAIEDNEFLCDLVHIKLGTGGNNVKICRNDLIRFTGGGGAPILVDVWVVPQTTGVNAGPGLEISDNKFGNENLNPADIRILLADNASGTNFITQQYATTLSTGFVEGVRIIDNLVNGSGSMTAPFLFSYTPNFRTFTIDNNYGGGFYNGIVGFSNLVTFADDRTTESSIINLDSIQQPFELLNPPYSNQPSLGVVTDSFGLNAGNPFHRNDFESGYDPAYTPLDTDASFQINLMTAVNAVVTPTTDSTGDNNAGAVAYSADGDAAYIFGRTLAVTPGRMAWFEIDVQQGASQSLSAIRVDFQNTLDVTQIGFRRFIALPPTWQTVRFSFVPRVVGPYNVLIHPVGYVAGVTQNALIGRAHFRHAVEPVHPGAYYMQASKSYTPGAIGGNASVTSTVTVPGAANGDFVVVSSILSLLGATISASVSAANTVTFVIFNPTGSVITLGATTIYARVFRRIV